VALILRRRGIERVRPLAGGYLGWRDRGYPLMAITMSKPVPAPRLKPVTSGGRYA
jgi:hypothetical protein